MISVDGHALTTCCRKITLIKKYCYFQDATEDEDARSGIKDAAAAVSDALNNLLNHLGNGGQKANDKYDDILNASEKLHNSMGNADEMVKQAKILAQVCYKEFV